MISAENRLIVALDVPTKSQALEIVAAVRETGCAFKVGLQLFTSAGADFVRELIAQDARVFLDLKFHDIPNTVASAAVEVARLRVWMFNVHAAGGGEMLERTVGAVRETVARENLPPPKIIAVTVLTSADQNVLRQTGIESEVSPQVVRLAKLTRDAGLDGVVASAQEAALIRAQIAEPNFLIVTPGIRSEIPSGGDDQKRNATAARAIQNGADYLVVGRPILTAPNKAAAVLKILRQIETASDSPVEPHPNDFI